MSKISEGLINVLGNTGRTIE